MSLLRKCKGKLSDKAEQKGSGENPKCLSNAFMSIRQSSLSFCPFLVRITSLLPFFCGKPQACCRQCLLSLLEEHRLLVSAGSTWTRWSSLPQPVDAWPKALCFGRGTTGTMVQPELTAWLEVTHGRAFQLGSERDKGKSHLDVFTSSS